MPFHWNNTFGQTQEFLMPPVLKLGFHAFRKMISITMNGMMIACAVCGRLEKFLSPEEVAATTVDGMLRNEEYVCIPRIMGYMVKITG